MTNTKKNIAPAILSEMVFYNKTSIPQHGPFNIRSVTVDVDGGMTIMGEFWVDFPGASRDDRDSLERKYKTAAIRKLVKPRTLKVSVSSGQYGVGYGVTVRGELTDLSDEFIAALTDVVYARVRELNKVEREKIAEASAKIAKMNALVEAVAEIDDSRRNATEYAI